MIARLADTIARLRGGERSVSTDTLRIYALQAIALALSLGSNVLVARVLGPDGKGRFDLFLLVCHTLPEIGLFGLSSGLLYHLANKGRPISEVHGTGLAAALVLGLGATAVGVAGLPAWSALLPGAPPWAIVLGFALAPATFYRLIWGVCMTGIDRAVSVHGFGVVVSAAALVGYVGCFAFGGLTVPGAIITAGAVFGATPLLAFWMLWRRGPSLQPSRELAGRAFRTGVILWIGLLANVIHFKVDQVMLDHLGGPDQVGIYNVGVRWAEMLFVLDGALISAALYKISSLDERDSYVLVGKVAWVQLALSGAAGLGLVALAWPLVRGLYGAAYLDAVGPLMLLVPGVVSWSIAKVLSQYLAFQRGQMWIPTSFAVIGLALNVGLNLAWIPSMKVVGAALASTCSYGLVMVCTVATFVWMGRRGRMGGAEA